MATGTADDCEESDDWSGEFSAAPAFVATGAALKSILKPCRIPPTNSQPPQQPAKPESKKVHLKADEPGTFGNPIVYPGPSVSQAKTLVANIDSHCIRKHGLAVRIEHNLDNKRFQQHIGPILAARLIT